MRSAEELRAHQGGRTAAGWDEPPAARLPDGLQQGALLPSVTLDTARNDQQGRERATGRHKRILRELAKYVKDPHPKIEVLRSSPALALNLSLTLTLILTLARSSRQLDPNPHPNPNRKS